MCDIPMKGWNGEGCPVLGGVACNGKGKCHEKGLCTCQATYEGIRCEVVVEAVDPDQGWCLGQVGLLSKKECEREGSCSEPGQEANAHPKGCAKKLNSKGKNK